VLPPSPPFSLQSPSSSLILTKTRRLGANFQEQSTDSILFSAPCPSSLYPPLRGATLNGLIAHAANPNYFDRSFVRSFLIGYRKFTTSDKIFSVLLKLFRAPKISNDPTCYARPTQPSLKQVLRGREHFRAEKKNSIPGACSVIRFWLKRHPYDFLESPQLLKKFMEKFLKRKDLKVFTNEFEILFAEINEAPDVTTNVTSFLTDSSSKSKGEGEGGEREGEAVGGGGRGGGGGGHFILQYDAETIAQQMCLIEEFLFRKIRVSEFVSLGWEKKDVRTAPMILEVIRRFNNVTTWVVSEILNSEKRGTRVQLIRQFIKILKHLEEYRNFNSIMEIISGLEVGVVCQGEFNDGTRKSGIGGRERREEKGEGREKGGRREKGEGREGRQSGGK
jgi:uncharacterized membrane protein YgcG